ncbi:MAG TPA: hypothetical protein PKE55_02885 [Kiritimatiellia bacterium]|nr:hypothetical protein [Kiritimatiellia bacterium]
MKLNVNRPAPAPEPPPPPPPAAVAAAKKKKEDKKAPVLAVIFSVIAHVLLIVGAGYLTVLVISGREKVMFEAKQPPSIPARKLEHSIRVKQMQQQVRKPQILQRLVSQAPSAVALPELPKMDAPDVKKMRDTPMTQRSASLVGDLGRAGGGLGRGDTGGAGFSDVKFFGNNVRSRAIIILIDVTTTVFNIGAMDALKKEAAELMKALHPGTKFNLIVYVDGAGSYQPQMVFALEEHKKGALEWLDSLVENDRRGNAPGIGGTSPLAGLQMAVEMGADTIFIVADADFPKIWPTQPRRGPVIEGHADEILAFTRSIETRYGRTVRINPVIFYPSKRPHEWNETRAYYRRMVGYTGGRMTVID